MYHNRHIVDGGVEGCERGEQGGGGGGYEEVRRG